jgi:hydroxylaminobenzene mutase
VARHAYGAVRFHDLRVYGTYANWLATQLGSLWGAGHRLAPGATGQDRAAATQERIVDLLLITLAPAMVLLIVGILR